MKEVTSFPPNLPKYFTNLTPMRGIAALLTLVYHVGFFAFPLGILVNPGQTFLINHFYLMVDFFFILSGFILFHVYGHYFSNGVSFNLFKKFTAARFARVYPLHILTLVYLMVVLFLFAKKGVPIIPVLEISNGFYTVFTNIFLVSAMNLSTWFSWNHASWSISTEWWAYMIFPFLVPVFIKMKTYQKVGMVLLCLIGYLAITFFITSWVTIPKEIPFVKLNPKNLTLNVSYQYGFLRCLCGFILGMVIYQAYTSNWLRPLLSNGYILLGGLIFSFLGMHFNLPDILSILPFPFIILSGAYGSKGIDAIFNLSPFQKLGDWSFQSI